MPPGAAQAAHRAGAPLQTIRLGRTGVEVSVAGLGCGGYSRLGMRRGASVDDAARIVATALDLGVTFIDTARAYGTEEAVGLGVRGRRQQVFISTKASPSGGAGGWATGVISAAALTESLEGSLRRLGTDYVDLFHLHGVPAEQYDHWVDVLLPELWRLQQAGKVRFLGVTEAFGADTDHQMLSRAVRDDCFDVVTVGFNLLNPSARRFVFPQTLSRDIGAVVMFAVRRAARCTETLRETVAWLIGRGEIDPEEVDLDDPLGFLRRHPDVGSEVEAAYRFCRHEPGAQVVLTGTGDIGHLCANIAAINAPPLPPPVQARLARIFGGVESVSGN